MIDNASLTAVQRVLGDIVVSNPDTVNGDLVAFENLVQAILFYDDLVCIDSYKPEYRESRKKEFAFVRFVAPEEVSLNPVEKKAKSEADSIRPEVRGGEFVDNDFSALLQMLKMNMVCTWDMASSNYYLTMKMLGQPNTPEFQKYSEVSASIFSELSDVGNTYGRWSNAARFVGSDGQEHTSNITSALTTFIASLNWLAYKSIYYSLAASYLKADTFLHPIRHAYQIHWMRKTGAFGHDFTSKLLGALKIELSTTVEKIIDNGRSQAISMEIPIFSAWLALQGGDVSSVIRSALEIRNNNEFQEIRGMLRDIRVAYDEEGFSEANKRISRLELELKKASDKTLSLYGIRTDQGFSTSFIMKAYNSVAAIKGLPQFPEFDFKIPLPAFLGTKSSSFSCVYKNVTAELTSIERLGGVRDILGARFNIDDERYSPPKTEAPEYRYVTSHWKKPM
ncbi:hypothetical protein [Ectothiorhodospira shaposhnikovii]|uniref:hypothetical protein n=1 Tax=Ectothiorhodospira shaposhnikovii TaxID=1054 RepID=UPI00399F569B